MRTVILLFVFSLPCFAAAQGNTQQRKDSLRTIIASAEGLEKLDAYLLLTNIYFQESARDGLKMDTLLALYREYDAEALRQERYKAQGLVRTNTLAAYLNRNELDEVSRLAPEYLAYLAKHEVWQHYYAVYRTLLQVSISKGEYEQAIEQARQMYNEAKQRGHDDGMGMALYQLSMIYGKMSRPEEEEKYMRECIENIEKNNDLLWLTAQAYSRLCNVLIYSERYDEAMQKAQELEKINYRYDEITKTKQITSWQNLWRAYLRLYLKKNDYNQAEIYCNKLDSSGGGPIVRYSIYTARAKIYNAYKQYDRALEMADKALEMSAGDPNETNENLGVKIMILCAKEGVGNIHALFDQAVNLRDSIRNTEMNARLDELRTVYEVDKHVAEKERNRNYFLLSLAGCILLAIIVVIYIVYSHRLHRKNRSLYRQIQESVRNEREAAKMLEIAPEEELSREMMLYRKVNALMESEKPFIASEFDRSALAQVLGTNEKYLADAIKAGNGATVASYISDCRLAYSLLLLSEQADIQLDIIAENSGHGSYSAFFRAFIKKYGMSPSDYRKLSKSSKGN